MPGNTKVTAIKPTKKPQQQEKAKSNVPPIKTKFFRNSSLDIVAKALDIYMSENEIIKDQIIKIYFNTVFNGKSNLMINTVMLTYMEI